MTDSASKASHLLLLFSSKGDFTYLHQNKKACKEEQRGPLHPVQDYLKVLQVSQNQKPQSTQDRNPT